jgi:dTDP-4-dehydrorhamnose reductase
MVTVLGHRGMLGSVVARRWIELGASGDYTVNCIRPDDFTLTVTTATKTRLIQPSTDAIAEPGAYAETKRAIERLPGIVVIRSGLVDITRQPPVAYTNWWCNPLTPLEWADLAWERRDAPGIHIAGREPVTRYEVAVAVANTFGGPLPVGAEADRPGSRIQAPDRARPSLAEALAAYRDWL